MEDDAEHKARKILEDACEKMKPVVNRMKEAIHEMVVDMAGTYGHEITKANSAFYDALTALQYVSRIEDSANTMLREVHDYAMQCKFSNPGAWSRAAAVRDSLDEDMTGETLGFGTLLRSNPGDPDQLIAILNECGDFYAVPPDHRAKIGWFTEQIQTSRGKQWCELTIEWVHIYALIVNAITLACGFPVDDGALHIVDGKMAEGGHRRIRH